MTYQDVNPTILRNGGDGSAILIPCGRSHVLMLVVDFR
jgi:hypothetical protein